jgi:predicted enzyme related to lactoylglutathione lyase
MRGAMVDVPRHGGTLLQITVDDVAAAAKAAEQAGGVIALGSDQSDEGTAFVHSRTGFTVELQPRPAP